VLTPAYKIIVGRKFIDTTDEPKASTVTELTVTLDMEAPADSTTLVLGNVNGLKPVRDDDFKIELGYEDNGSLTQVMVGSVVTVEPGLTTKRVVAYSAADTLLRTFVDRTYEEKSAAQIVRDLVNQANGGGSSASNPLPVGGSVGNAAGSAIANLTGRTNLEVESADDGIQFPAYVIDSQRSVYHHMRDLADLCGFDLYINANGKLVFEEFGAGKTVHVFEYAKHIITLDVQRTPPRATQVEAWGESPAGRGGANAWAWLTNDFSSSKGTAGSAGSKFLLERPALRTATAARTAAQAALTAIERRTLQGRLLVLGDPTVKLGDAIRLTNIPDDSLNQTFQVRGVTHRMTKLGGFTTSIEFRSIST
jgi:hypothetical protein